MLTMEKYFIHSFYVMAISWPLALRMVL